MSAEASAVFPVDASLSSASFSSTSYPAASLPVASLPAASLSCGGFAADDSHLPSGLSPLNQTYSLLSRVEEGEEEGEVEGEREVEAEGEDDEEEEVGEEVEERLVSSGRRGVEEKEASCSEYRLENESIVCLSVHVCVSIYL